MKARYKSYFKIIVSVVLMWLVSSKLSYRDLITYYQNTNPMIIVFVAIIAYMQICANALILKSLFKSLSCLVKFIDAAYLSFIKSVYSFALPSTIGGDVYFTVLFGKKWDNYVRAGSSILFIRIIGFASYLVMAFVALVLSDFQLFELLGSRITVKLAGKTEYWVIALLALTIVVVVIRKKALAWAKSVMFRVSKTFKDIIKSGRAFAGIVVFTVLWGLISLCGRLFLARFIGIDLDLFLLSSIILSINLILMLPVSISGVGVREVSYIGFLSLYGISTEQGFLLSALDFAITICVVLTGAILLLLKHMNVIKSKTLV